MKKVDAKKLKQRNPNITIDEVLSSDEKIYWRGKPNKKSYILSNLTRWVLFGTLWLTADLFFISILITSGAAMGAAETVFLVIFFAFHMTPVWFMIARILMVVKEADNLEYAVTNKRVLVRSGVIGIDFKSMYFSDISNVSVKVGFVDRMFQVGDVYVNNDIESIFLFDISDPYRSMANIQKLVMDVKADVRFPNAYRPKKSVPYYNAPESPWETVSPDVQKKTDNNNEAERDNPWQQGDQRQQENQNEATADQNPWDDQTNEDGPPTANKETQNEEPSQDLQKP